jgi:predicted amidohydrolase YtcJ
MSLLIRNVEVGGRRGLDVRLTDGVISEIGEGLTGGEEFDGRGGALIPGLIDHHIHLLAAAARADSLTLDDIASPDELAARIAGAAAARPAGAWIRAVGYHGRIAGVLGREDLDRWAPDHPVRVQHQTGSLWMLNSAALAIVARGETPPGLERDAQGRPTGRVWRADSWLREQMGKTPPPLAPLGALLAACGVTGLTDASAGNDAETAAILADAHRTGALPQRLALMSANALAAPADGAFMVGPLKVLLDDHDLPALDDVLGRVARARSQGRAVAVHCVTAAELAFTLAVFGAAGAASGDRIEHGGVIPADAIAVLKGLGLTVVTQPAFVFERGDRYLADIDPAEHGELYRCASLLTVGVPVAGSSDAPYADPDPWSGLRAAIGRRTRLGEPLGLSEQITPCRALDLYLGSFADPGGPPRRVETGAPADLCLLGAPLAQALAAPDARSVAATFIAGRPVFAVP